MGGGGGRRSGRLVDVDGVVFVVVVDELLLIFRSGGDMRASYVGCRRCFRLQAYLKIHQVVSSAHRRKEGAGGGVRRHRRYCKL